METTETTQPSLDGLGVSDGFSVSGDTGAWSDFVIATDPAGAPEATINERWYRLYSHSKAMCELMVAFNTELEPGYAPQGLGIAVHDQLAKLENLATAARILITPAIAATGQWKREGAPNPERWFAGKTGKSPAKARAEMETGKNLGEAPGTREAFLEGELSAEQADTIADAVEANPEAEQALLDAAKDASLKELKDEAARRKAEVEDIEKRERRIHKGRYVRTWTDSGGAWNLHAKGTIPDGADFMSVLERLIDQQFKQARKNGVRGTRDNYAFDALMDMAAQHGKSGFGAGGHGNPGPADPGDPGPAGPGPSDPGPTNPGPTRPAPNGNGPTKPGPANPGPDDQGPTHPGPGDTGPADLGPNEPGPTHPAPDGPRPTDPGPTGFGSKDIRPASPRPSDPARPDRSDTEATNPGSNGPGPTSRASGKPTSPAKRKPNARKQPTRRRAVPGPTDLEPLDQAPTGTGASGSNHEGPMPDPQEGRQERLPSGDGQGPKRRPRRPVSQQQIYCIAWNALVRGRALIGERCELRGIGPVSVSAVRRALADAGAKLVITDTDGRAVTVTHLGTGKINLRLIPGLTDPTRIGSADPQSPAARACDPQQLFEVPSDGDGGAGRAGPLTRIGEPSQSAAAMMTGDAETVRGYGGEPKLVIIGVGIGDLTDGSNRTTASSSDCGPHAGTGTGTGTATAFSRARQLTSEVPTVEIPGVGTVDPDRVIRLLGLEATGRLATRGQAVRQIVHTGRAPTAAQRIALAWADTTCKVHGCPNQRVEIDHRTPWASARTTEIDNLDPLCSAHHDLKTNHGWQFIHPSSRSFVPPEHPDHPGPTPLRRPNQAGR